MASTGERRSISFRIIGDGLISPPGDSHAAVAVGARCAVIDSDIVCSCMVQSSLGINDFIPVLWRSVDGGQTWKAQGPIWPWLQSEYSIFCSISRSLSGELFLYGTRTPIDRPGETFWSDAAQGLKQNELIWARSADGGRTWTDPTVIPMPVPGSAEAPGPLCVTRDGVWLVCYAPYHSFDPSMPVDRSQVIVLRSEDRGVTWRHTAMLRFDQRESGAAEAWIIELADGRILGTSWHMNLSDGSDYPNAYALSLDCGRTWLPTRSTGISGQSAALAALADGRALFIYNQRRHGRMGVWLAVVRPTEENFGIETNQIIWQAERAIQSRSSGKHSQWRDFAFGEPSVTLLSNTLLAMFWCIQPSGRGIRWFKLKMV